MLILPFQLDVRIAVFRDTDIADSEEAKEAMHHYEWTITDGEESKRILSTWTRVIPTLSFGNEVSILFDLDRLL